MILFDGTILNTVTKYVGIPVVEGTIGVTIGWRDATSDAAITLEITSADVESSVEGNAWDWVDSGETIAGPDGTVEGCTTIDIGNCRQTKARLKIVAGANCSMLVSGRIA